VPIETDPDAIEALVRAEGLLRADGPVVVLFSGGRDSVALLDLAVRISGVHHTAALHVNYGLRASAAEDEAHCVALCGDLGVELTVRRPASPSRGNVQGWARDVRYGEATRLAEERGGADIAAGHTATDQVETVLYRLASSPSRRALLGMRARDGALIRPLLGLTREQTTVYCEARGHAYVDDPTNDSDAYARNRARRELVPALRRLHPAAEANVLALLEILRDEAGVLDALVDEALAGRDRIALDELAAMPRALARLLVQALADRAAGGPASGTARRLAEIQAMGTDAILDLPLGVRAVTEAGVLRFERTPPLRR
jgi:tRNA(Ile)-lysidine synthase